jgi:hypothetical protein
MELPLPSVPAHVERGPVENRFLLRLPDIDLGPAIDLGLRRQLCADPDARCRCRAWRHEQTTCCEPIRYVAWRLDRDVARSRLRRLHRLGGLHRPLQ